MFEKNKQKRTNKVNIAWYDERLAIKNNEKEILENILNKLTEISLT